MQINREYDRELNFRDLFFHLCYRWRSILLAALIGAIALGAFQFARITMTHRAGEQTKEEKQYDVDLQNYKDSIRNARNSIRTYNKLIKEKNDYLDESVYMGLDSQDEWLARKRFYIKMDQAVLDAQPDGSQEDPADYVASVYASTFKSGLDAAEMEALLGTGRKDYIDELVWLSTDSATNTITLQVIGAEEETVEKQLAFFEDRMDTVSAPLAQEVGAHVLVPVSEDVNARTDNDLSAKQDEINQQIVQWQEALKEQRELLNNLEESGEPNPPGTHIKRFAAIGFIVAAILLAGIYVLSYFFGNRLHCADELIGHYDLPVYGDYAHSRARRPDKGLDKLFEKWEFKHAVTDARAVDGGICALLREDCAGKRLLLTGDVPEARLDDLAGRLRGALGGALEIAAQGGLTTNPAAIGAVKGADAVILVAEKHVSRNADIERAAQLLEIDGTDVKGCIVL